MSEKEAKQALFKKKLKHSMVVPKILVSHKDQDNELSDIEEGESLPSGLGNGNMSLHPDVFTDLKGCRKGSIREMLDVNFKNPFNKKKVISSDTEKTESQVF